MNESSHEYDEYESNSPVQKHKHEEEKVSDYEDKVIQHEDLH